MNHKVFCLTLCYYDFTGKFKLQTVAYHHKQMTKSKIYNYSVALNIKD